MVRFGMSAIKQEADVESAKTISPSASVRYKSLIFQLDTWVDLERLGTKYMSF